MLFQELSHTAAVLEMLVVHNNSLFLPALPLLTSPMPPAARRRQASLQPTGEHGFCVVELLQFSQTVTADWSLSWQNSDSSSRSVSSSAILTGSKRCAKSDWHRILVWWWSRWLCGNGMMSINAGFYPMFAIWLWQSEVLNSCANDHSIPVVGQSA